MTDFKNRNRITIHIADAPDNEKLIVEVIIDNSLIFEISKVNDDLVSRILVNTHYKPQPIDFLLLQEALKAALYQAETL